MASVKEDLIAIPIAFLTSYSPIFYLKISFFVASLLYLLCFPFNGSKKSFWDVISARKIIRITRWLVLLECLILLPLIYFKVYLGQPLELNAVWKYVSNSNESWVYGYVRPISCILLIGCGGLGDLHIALRLFCLLGCFQEIMCGTISTYQVYDYYIQAKFRGAPIGNYTLDLLQFYFIRDAVSAGVCLLILLFTLQFCFIVGWKNPQIIPYALISGGDLDRCEVMRQQRELKKVAEYKHRLAYMEYEQANTDRQCEGNDDNELDA